MSNDKPKTVNVQVEKVVESGFFGDKEKFEATVTTDVNVASARAYTKEDAIALAQYKAEEKASGGGCFVTTACVEVLGLTNDCYEMTVLRAFRDKHLLASEVGKFAVSQYYKIAPAIVAAVNRAQQPEAEFRYIYSVLIRPTVKLVEEGKLADASDFYRDGIVMLAHKYGISVEKEPVR